MTLCALCPDDDRAPAEQFQFDLDPATTIQMPLCGVCRASVEEDMRDEQEVPK